MNVYLKIFIAFLIPGVIGFGGGPASIAIINSIVVDNFGLISQSEFNVLVSISNALPGPVATLLALGTGYVSASLLGGIIAVIAIVLPSAVAVIFLYNFLVKHKNDYRIKRILKYIFPVIIALFIQLVYRFLVQSFAGLNNFYLTIFIIISSFLLLVKTKIHPVFIMVLAMILGYFSA